MTRASIQITPGQRGPPRKHDEMNVPAGMQGPWQEQPYWYVPEPEYSVPYCVEQVRRAIAQMRQNDREMTEMEIEMELLIDKLEDPTTDKWDLDELNKTYDQMYSEHCTLWFSFPGLVRQVIKFGELLIAEWRDQDLDNIARRTNIAEGFYGRASQLAEFDSRHPVWQRVRCESVPF